ncbi:hypothetical protein ABT160_31105 [Streptomyces sp. NPDC001941]|uniref:hypothetical protein n=1 Tax=Streptomyces sp. NPDC001941 TaxID=3154659 RepID=UPI00331DA0C6
MLRVRALTRIAWGPHGTHRRFHDALLSLGMPPVGLLERALVGDHAPCGRAVETPWTNASGGPPRSGWSAGRVEPGDRTGDFRPPGVWGRAGRAPWGPPASAPGQQRPRAHGHDQEQTGRDQEALAHARGEVPGEQRAEDGDAERAARLARQPGRDAVLTCGSNLLLGANTDVLRAGLPPHALTKATP